MGLAVFFTTIRWKNLLMIAAIQLLFKYIYLPAFGIATVLDPFHFGLLILATIAIAAAGNIINDIEDIEADVINKPSKVLVTKHLSKKKATQYYYACNFIGLVVGFYIAYHVNRCLICGNIHWYSTAAKRIFDVIEKTTNNWKYSGVFIDFFKYFNCRIL